MLSDRDTYLDLLTHVVIVLAIGLLAWLIIGVARALIRRAAHRVVENDLRRNEFSQAARHRTLASLALSLIRYTVWFATTIGILGTWNVHFLGLLGTALGTAGVLGIVVGFGAQKLVRDVITGFFMLMEDQYAVGDTVTIGAVTGVVEEFGIRVTRVRDDIGRLNLIPNGDISQVTNHSRGGLDAAIEVGVPLDQDLDAVGKLVKQAGEKVMAEEHSPISAAPRVQGITAMDGTKMTLRVTATAVPGKQKDAEMALRAALREVLLGAGIKIV